MDAHFIDIPFSVFALILEIQQTYDEFLLSIVEKNALMNIVKEF
jgi:hypothetical protein